MKAKYRKVVGVGGFGNKLVRRQEGICKRLTYCIVYDASSMYINRCIQTRRCDGINVSFRGQCRSNIQDGGGHLSAHTVQCQITTLTVDIWFEGKRKTYRETKRKRTKSLSSCFKKNINWKLYIKKCTLNSEF